MAWTWPAGWPRWACNRRPTAGCGTLPVSWQGTTRGLVQALAAHLGKPAKVQAFPDWALRALGLLDPVLGAAAEMTYQWKLPYLLDDTRFRQAFGVDATPAAQAVAETAEWVRDIAQKRQDGTRAAA